MSLTVRSVEITAPKTPSHGPTIQIRLRTPDGTGINFRAVTDRASGIEWECWLDRRFRPLTGRFDPWVNFDALSPQVRDAFFFAHDLAVEITSGKGAFLAWHVTQNPSIGYEDGKDSFLLAVFTRWARNAPWRKVRREQ